MRITFVIHAMGQGGAERVMATMANYWAGAGWPVTLFTLEDDHRGSFYPLHPQVRLRHLGIAGSSAGALQAARNNVNRIVALRRAIVASRPDAVISFLDQVNVLTLTATRGTGIPVLVEEHTDPAAKKLGRAWELQRSLLYRRAARVVVLSETARGYFPAAIQQRSAIVPNPIVIGPGKRPLESSGRKTLISLGRLSPEKGFDRLIAAFGAVADRHPHWDLVIWGDGTARQDLERHRDALGLGGRVRLPGTTPDPHCQMRRANAFALTSRREGFPMALGEAMACGLPVLAVDCPSGPRQLIRRDIDGLLVPDNDPAALQRALDGFLGDELLRTRFALRGPEVLERFGVTRVMQMWESLLSSVVRSPERPFLLAPPSRPEPRLAAESSTGGQV